VRVEAQPLASAVCVILTARAQDFDLRALIEAMRRNMDKPEFLRCAPPWLSPAFRVAARACTVCGLAPRLTRDDCPALHASCWRTSRPTTRSSAPSASRAACRWASEAAHVGTQRG
jgi:hypothetical protein